LIVRGTVANHSAAAHTFKIGALTVDYTTNPAVFSNLPAPVDVASVGNWNGLFVSVTGTSCSLNGNICGTLTASNVAPALLGLSNATVAQLEGYITTLSSNADFTVNSQRVLTTGSTIYSGGTTADILLGTHLEVEGSMAAGVITATKIRFKDNVVIDANVTAAITGSTLTLDGLPGITATANAFTDLPIGVTPTNLAASLAGHNVRIRGRANPSNVPGGVIATRIQDRGAANNSGNMSLTAFAGNTNVNTATFSLLGLTVDTSQLASNADFRDVTGSPISSAAFFGALTPNGGLVTAVRQFNDPLIGGNAFAAGALKEVQLGDSN
jgi:hypothetical protein